MDEVVKEKNGKIVAKDEQDDEDGSDDDEDEDESD